MEQIMLNSKLHIPDGCFLHPKGYLERKNQIISNVLYRFEAFWTIPFQDISEDENPFLKCLQTLNYPFWKETRNESVAGAGISSDFKCLFQNWGPAIADGARNVIFKQFQLVNAIFWHPKRVCFGQFPATEKSLKIKRKPFHFQLPAPPPTRVRGDIYIYPRAHRKRGRERGTGNRGQTGKQ